MHFIDLETQQSRIKPELDRRIAAVLAHGQYIMGPEVAEMEERLADYAGVKHCIGVSSGTDSLLIAMMALGIGPGDEVITVPFTWISTAETIALLGAKTVFVDIRSDTWNMDPDGLAAAITPRTRAIMPVGIFGQTPDMDAINAIAGDHGNIPVIEDAAQSFGAMCHGRRSCGLSTIGSTSFFPSKPLGCYGDGGALFTDDDELAGKMRQIRVHGQARKHHHPILGLNARLDTLQAAIVLAKLEIFDEEIRRRQWVAAAYEKALLRGNGMGRAGFNGKSPVSHQPHPVTQMIPSGHTSVYAQYTILHPDRNGLATRLKKHGIPSVSYYAVPLHLQPIFAHLGYQLGDFPNTEFVSHHSLSLPMHPWLERSEIEKISACVTGEVLDPTPVH